MTLLFVAILVILVAISIALLLKYYKSHAQQPPKILDSRPPQSNNISKESVATYLGNLSNDYVANEDDRSIPVEVLILIIDYQPSEWLYVSKGWCNLVRNHTSLRNRVWERRVCPKPNSTTINFESCETIVARKVENWITLFRALLLDDRNSLSWFLDRTTNEKLLLQNIKEHMYHVICTLFCYYDNATSCPQTCEVIFRFLENTVARDWIRDVYCNNKPAPIRDFYNSIELTTSTRHLHVHSFLVRAMQPVPLGAMPDDYYWMCPTAAANMCYINTQYPSFVTEDRVGTRVPLPACVKRWIDDNYSNETLLKRNNLGVVSELMNRVLVRRNIDEGTRERLSQKIASRS